MKLETVRCVQRLCCFRSRGAALYIEVLVNKNQTVPRTKGGSDL
jgi:hypothetical protein